MDELAWIESPASEAVALVLAELGSHPESCPLVEDLAGRLGHDVEAVWDALGIAKRSGWVELWPDDPRGPSAVLSALSAGRLGLTLSSDGTRWLSPGQFERPDDGSPPYLTMTDLADPAVDDASGFMASLADSRALQGLDSLLLMERLAKMADDYAAELAAACPPPQPDGLTRLAKAWRGFGDSIRRSRLPEPILILGMSPPWPVRMPSTGPCPGCRSRPLGTVAYCLLCHRSGIDHLLAAAEPLPAGPGVVEVEAALERVAKKAGGKGKR